MSLLALAAPPDPPELPEAARPRWPAWHGPVALVTAIAVFGVVQCLIYERTGSLFAMIAACVLVPRRLGPAPSPFGRNPRARPQPA